MRSYRQHCAVAKALDVVGERWTLLLVRELLLGPRRYTDLLAGLPGIGTNLLASRLRRLEREGLVQRVALPPPAGSTAYELTDLGRGLGPAVLELGRFGAYLLERQSDGDATRPGWYVVSMLATFRPELAADDHTTYELRIDDDVFFVEIKDGVVTLGGATATPGLVKVTTELSAFLGLLAGTLDAEAALQEGLVSVDGGEGALSRFVQLFGWPAATERATRA